LVLIDRSDSMTGPTGAADPNNPGAVLDRYSAVAAAMRAFFKDKLSEGVTVALQHFPIVADDNPVTCTASAQCGAYGTCVDPFVDSGGSVTGAPNYCRLHRDSDNNPPDSCAPARYKKPKVEFAPLPGNLDPLLQNVENRERMAGTPMYPAVVGALERAKEHQRQVPDHKTILLLATDGVPSECYVPGTDTLRDVNAVATAITEGRSDPTPIDTFVIGIGEELTALNSLAVAGGTGSAFLLNASTNLTKELQSVLNSIRSSVRCTFPLPHDTAVDPEKVNVTFTPDGKPAESLQNTDPGECNYERAWHYDDPKRPGNVILCPATCAKVATQAGDLAVVLGCKTERLR